MEEIKRIPVHLVIKEYKVTFEYETRKGHRREEQRTIKHFNKEEARQYFKEWSKAIRTKLNVKILSIVELKDRGQIIEL